MPDLPMLLAGQPALNDTMIPVVNPATGEVIGHAPDCSPEQLDRAVAAARDAFAQWSATSDAQRGDLLKQAAGILLANLGELRQMLTAEQGKPLDEAEFEIGAAAYWLSAFADMAIPVEVSEEGPERKAITRHVPVGVIAGIAPWNFPVLLSFWKIAPALRAGNCMILKPSPFTPLTMLRIGELLRDLFPAGVLQIVTGGDRLGPMMTSHPGFDKVSFTGSTSTGKSVMASAAADLKRVTLELGGNDAAIVLPDADVEAVCGPLFWAAFRNSGQICIAAKRLYVHESIYDRLAEAMVRYARTVTVGNGAEQGVQLGPVQNRRQFERVVDLIRDCQAHGYRFLAGGQVDETAPGNFIPVTIVDNPPDDSRIVREEPFGPVLPLLRWHDLDEVIARANDTEFGLAGSVWGADLDRAQAVAARLETGTVWINEVQHVSPGLAFAGHKQSGIGVENGLAGLLEYTVPKTVTVRSAPVSGA